MVVHERVAGDPEVAGTIVGLPAGAAPRAGGGVLLVESAAVAPRPRPLSVGEAFARPPPRPPGLGWSRSRQESGRAPSQRASDSSNRRGATAGRWTEQFREIAIVGPRKNGVAASCRRGLLGDRRLPKAHHGKPGCGEGATGLHFVSLGAGERKRSVYPEPTPRVHRTELSHSPSQSHARGYREQSGVAAPFTAVPESDRITASSSASRPLSPTVCAVAARASSTPPIPGAPPRQRTLHRSTRRTPRASTASSPEGIRFCCRHRACSCTASSR